MAAAHVPEASLGRSDLEEIAGAEPVEDAALRVYPVASALPPRVVTFLDGIQAHQVIGYDGVVPIVHARVAAAARRRRDRRLGTADEESREFLVSAPELLRPAVAAALAGSGLALVPVAAAEVGQPGRALEAVRAKVERARVEVERALAERVAARLAPDEWLVVDGVLSESAVLAAHPRALGVIKSHGAQYFTGAELERALTLPLGHRTSVFRPTGRARHAVHSWYLRLWPWEGHDLLFGLLRVEAAPVPASPGAAPAAAAAAWLLGERTPLATPDARWDRLLYPIWDVERYLKGQVPRALRPIGAALPRLPRVAS